MLCSHARLNLLPTSGSVLFNRTTRQHGLVLQVSDAGVLLWKINSTRCGSQRLWYFDSDDGTNFVHVAITKEADWFCVDSGGVQPKQLAALIQQKQLSQPPDIQDAIVGIGVGEAKQPLLKYSCSKGFRSLTVPHLKLLWRRLKVTTSAPPQTTGPLLKGVAEHVLGTEVVLEELLARRERKQYTEIPTPLTAEMLEQCAEAISEQDLADIKQSIAAAGPQKSQASSSSSVFPKQRLPLEGKAEYTLTDVRPFFPQDVPISISRETRWHTRWRFHFPGYPSPNSASRTFGGVCSELQTIKRLIKEAWAIHEREGGQACPWIC